MKYRVGIKDHMSKTVREWVIEERDARTAAERVSRYAKKCPRHDPVVCWVREEER